MFQHPNKVCMTYSEHFLVSLRFSYIFAIASVKSLVHAFIPDIFISSTTDTIKAVSSDIHVLNHRLGDVLSENKE